MSDHRALAEPLRRAELAVEALRRGSIIVLTDAQDRENEADLVAVAQCVQPEQVNFMVTHARGLVCCTMQPHQLQALQLDVLDRRHTADHACMFAMSFDAAEGVTTGTSAYDRAHSIRLIADAETRSTDLATPGHVFPLQVHPQGLSGRQGHTEASTALVQRAGFQEGNAVICEVMADDGRMLKDAGIEQFASHWGLPVVSVHDVMMYERERM